MIEFNPKINKKVRHDTCCMYLLTNFDSVRRDLTKSVLSLLWIKLIARFGGHVTESGFFFIYYN